MNISGPTSSQISTSVWTAATRTLTSINAFLSTTQIPKTSLAAAAAVTFNAGASKTLDITVDVDNSNMTYGLTDGTNNFGAYAGTLAPFGYPGIGNTIIFRISNSDGASAHNYMLSGAIWNYT